MTSASAPSKVYFTSFRTHARVSTLDKLDRLCRKAGIGQIDFDNKFVAIKLHLGEPGGVAYLRPNYVKVVVDLVRELGGKPFLTDCNTLYVGGRKNALDHLDSAYANGFNPFCVGCHTIIADGLKGLDEVEVPVEGGEYVHAAKIGRAIMDADVVISMTHFKGHEATGFGGTIKNIGMGSGSRAGKMEQHSAGKPSVSQARCIGCRQCAKICAHDAISFSADPARGGKHVVASIDHDRCVGCGRCIGVCNQDAIAADYAAAVDVLNCKMAEYTKAVVDGRPAFHVSLVMDVSPNCDCHAENDTPIVPDIGMFASFDPVALDQACADAVNAAPTLGDTVLSEQEEALPDDPEMADHFHMVHPDTRWESCLDHAERLGLGTRAYEIVEVR
ncbi:MAG: DUF362 domain-containing protein [Atopobiaceae bacterium]|jgi:uncharacterized Fe-S center protein|nr:DUF362 domain-containing protein [Atopobiaceae bacterium]